VPPASLRYRPRLRDPGRYGDWENAEEDARRFYRSEEGIVLVTRDMLRKLGHKQER
jgi:hypothetical protein